MGKDQRGRMIAMPGVAGGVPIIGDPRNPLNHPPQIRDLYGRVLREGDGVTLHTLYPQVFKVAQIIAVVEPDVRPGCMDITLVSTVRFRAMRNQVNQEFARVLQVEEVVGRQQGGTGAGAQAEPDETPEPEPEPRA
jgi:hypothetical protein